MTLVGLALEPEPGAARDLLRRELSGAEYRPSLVEQARDYVLDLVGRAMDALAEAGAFDLATLLVLAALLATALLWLASRLRPETRVRQAAPVLGETTRTAAEHRAAARDAASAGRWDEVVVESLRSVARELERPGAGAAVRPGSTAREVVGVAQARYPDHRDDLDAAARSFEDVVYGDRHAAADEARRALAVAEAVALAEPQHAGVGPTAAAPR